MALETEFAASKCSSNDPCLVQILCLLTFSSEVFCGTWLPRYFCQETAKWPFIVYEASCYLLLLIT